VPSGKTWARLQVQQGIPYTCDVVETLAWSAKSAEVFDDLDLERTFRTAMTQAGLAVSGDTDNLFETDQKSADLQIGALITNVDAVFCAKTPFISLSTARVSIAGTASMEIEWQVYSSLQGRILARIPTRGRVEDKKGAEGGQIFLLQRAFAENVRALAETASFRAVLRSPSPGATPVAAMERLSLKGPSAAPRSPADASSAVALVFVGEATGSAFLISPDGYLLTNHHVVGDARQVRLRWNDKSEVVADVIRSDRRRDVALLRVATGARRPLALRPDTPGAGETVFAIGTPLETDFQNTVTRGIVSGNREFEGLSFVQSDVAVHQGNSGGPLIDDKGRVVAITAWGYAPGGVTRNLNFFIPVHDALKVLGVDLAVASASR